MSTTRDSAADLPIDPAPAVSPPAPGHRRFLILRTCPAGALDGLDAATKAGVNAGNAQHDARWVYSYANSDKTRTVCIYEGPTEQSVRDAATTTGLPIDEVLEMPVVLLPR
jgi:hypothetical protein